MSEARSDSEAATSLLPLFSPVVVTDTASLKAAIDQVNSAVAGAYIIQLANDITETGAQDAINLQTGVTLTIEGGEHTLDGGNQYRGFFAYAGAITIQNLSINDMLAKGGAGGYGGGGGGAGLGGGLFVAGSNPGLSSGASVVLDNVSFSHDQAAGGMGNTNVYSFSMLDPSGSAGGGGGLGGNGGNYNLAGGGGGGIGGDAGMAGIVPGAASGGSSGPNSGNGNRTPGGVNGGGGGNGTPTSFATGGGGGIGGTSGAVSPPNGGFGGGGGGGVGGSAGGNGGFGGGGGGRGGNGGFGGGGADGGLGGFGGGSGGIDRSSNNQTPSVYEGGGGLGAGGAIFVQSGGNLTLQGGSIGGGSAIGGAVQAAAGFTTLKAQAGLGLGAGIYVNDFGLTLSAAAGQTTTVADAIASDPGSAGLVLINGPGTVVLSGVNSYTGTTRLQLGATLELASPTAAGKGEIYFVPNTGATLRLDAGAFTPAGLFPTMVTGFQGDYLDLPSLAYAPDALVTVSSGPNISVTSNGVTRQIGFDAANSNGPAIFRASSDGNGGTLVQDVGGPVIIGSGPSTIFLGVAEDAYLGDAQFTIAVDGVQLGGVQTALVPHASGTALFEVQGNFGSYLTPHQVTVNFLNDAYGGAPNADRNLYVNFISSVAPGFGEIDAELASTGPLTFNLNGPYTTGPVIVGSGPNRFTLDISEDAYSGSYEGAGNALFQITVDGVQVGPLQTATASHASGQTQAFTVEGNFALGPHVVGVTFVNDLYDGSPATDRNLYVDGAQSGDQSYGGLVLDGAGTQYLTISIPVPTSVTLGSGPDTIELNVSEDAFASAGQTDAQFTISVDGKQVGGVQTAYAARSQSKTEAFLVQGAFGTGPHAVTVNFLNDAYGGSPSYDRNLYVDSIIAGGQLYGGITLQAGGPQTETVQTPVDVTLGSGPQALNFSLSEDALAGADVQFTLSIGGVQVGGVQTITASHAAGADQLLTVLGDFRLNATQAVTLNVLNGGGGRNLYIDALTRAEGPGVISGTNTSPTELSASGAATLSFGAASPTMGPVTVGSGPDSLTVDVSVPASGPPLPFGTPFIVVVDGVQLGGDEYATVRHAPGSTQAFTFKGSFGTEPHNLLILPQTGNGAAAFVVDAITDDGLTTQLNTFVSETGMFFRTSPPSAVLSGSALTGPAGGSAVLNGTPGSDTITAQGGHNTINGLGGNDTVMGSIVGGDTITVGAAGDTSATQDKVSIAGDGNTVAAINASVALTGSAINTVVNLAQGANTVQLNGAGNTINVGDGNNILNVTGGQAQITIAGQQEGQINYSDTITLSGTGNQVSRLGVVGGNVSVTGGTGNGNFFTAPGAVTINTDGLNNNIEVTGGAFNITAGSGADHVTATGTSADSVGTITLAGLSNVVDSEGSQSTITGGSGSGTFYLRASGSGGGGIDTLMTGGTNNTVQVTASQTTVDPGSGADTVSIYGTGTHAVTFHGQGDMLFLHSAVMTGPNTGGVTATVTDQSSNLQVFIDPFLRSLTLSQFGADGVLHLLSGAGGYASAAAAAAAITTDTGGGTMLVLPTFNTPGVSYGSGVIHFAAGEHITAANFSIG